MTAGDWFMVVIGVLIAHGLFLIGAHMGLWGTDPNGHIRVKGLD